MDAISQPIDVLKTASAARFEKNKASRKEIEGIAKDFESVFMAQMIKPMWEGVETDSMFGGGVGEDVMRDLLIQEYGKSMTSDLGSSLSASIVEAMVKMQDMARNQASYGTEG
ncbi:MAG: rod-binding protein [Proteobacteria bacterium]|jgi:Rod binding domain-containing protein|nr:rod-binding protein [Alphaproteobacteria bacterium]NCC03527.1 rod-binding protein [Pseudomonadota bacterium]